MMPCLHDLSEVEMLAASVRVSPALVEASISEIYFSPTLVVFHLPLHILVLYLNSDQAKRKGGSDFNSRIG
jgi:hypothetical protein